MTVTISLLILITSAVALVKGVNLFNTSVSKIAHNLKVSKYTISFFLVAIGTSLPELLVSINAGIQKSTILAFGTVIGSNIALLTLILAIPIILGKRIPTKLALRNQDLYIGGVFALLPIALASDNMLSRQDGMLLLFAYGIYAIIVFKKAQGLENLLDNLQHNNVWKELTVFLISLVVLLASSILIVKTSLELSALLGVGVGFIGLLTALGTSLPELSYGFKNTQTHEEENILGTILGSIAANSTLVLGTASLLHPIDLYQTTISSTALLFTVVLVLIFFYMSITRSEISKKEAVVLIALYALFIFVETYTQLIN